MERFLIVLSVLSLLFVSGCSRRKADRDNSENVFAYKGAPIKSLHIEREHDEEGRMTMTDADRQIFDADPKDAFDFYPKQMNRQISAGYVKVKDDGGLKIFAPDFGEIDQSTDLRPKP